MLFSQFINQLENTQRVLFKLPNGKTVAPHFHLTELGVVNRKTVDCGGTIRNENKTVLQLWEATDFQHRLEPGKLATIARQVQKTLEFEDTEIEIEYQNETIGRYGLISSSMGFELVPLYTDCLAKESCGIPEEKDQAVACCGSGSSCC